MPKLKQSQTEKFNRTLVADIKHGMYVYNISPESMAACMGVSRGTLFSRFRNPQAFTIGELMSIARNIHTTLNELLEQGEKKGE